MIDKDIILAALPIIGTLVSILFVYVRTRGKVDTTKAQQEADEAKRRSELEALRLQAWSQMVILMEKTTERLDVMSGNQRQSNQVATQVSETLEKNTLVLKEQAETLDTATDLLSSIGKRNEAYQKQGLTAIETVQTLPGHIDGVKTSIAEAKKVIDTLPEDLRKELAPVNQKLEALDKHVEQMAVELKREIATVRSEVTAAIKAALAPSTEVRSASTPTTPPPGPLTTVPSALTPAPVETEHKSLAEVNEKAKKPDDPTPEGVPIN